MAAVISIRAQAGVEGSPCTVCRNPIPKGDGWSLRHPENDPFAVLTCCGNCINLIVDAAFRQEPLR